MAVLFAGGELSAFTPSNGTNVSETTSSTGRDTAYTRVSITVNNTAAYAETALFGPATDLWVHFEWYQSSLSASSSPINFYNSAGTAVFRLRLISGTTLQMDYWNGSAWTAIGDAVAYSAGSRYTLDVKLVCGASGSVALYSSGSLLTGGEANMTAVDNISKVRFGTNGNTAYWSQVIVADEPTIGWKLATMVPDGDGANTAWAGGYADVDETGLSDVDLISSSVADQVETFSMTNAPDVSGYTVKALAVTARARRGESGPQNLQAAVRSGGANYFSGNLPGIDVGYKPLVSVFENDPNTGVAWTLANLNAAEVGLKSVA